MNGHVSIIIPTFNRAHLLGKTLDSFISQSFENWEAIIIDDGSTDNTKEVVQAKEDSRIKYFKRSKEFKKGPAGSRNCGLSHASGDYILFFDDDDIAHPNLLEIALPYLSKNEIDYCRYLRSVFYKEEDIVFDPSVDFNFFKISKNDFDKIVSNKLPMNTCAVIWKRNALGQEKFNEDLFYSDEWEYFQRLLSHGTTGISIDKILVFARKHAVSSTDKFLGKNEEYVNSTYKANELAIENIYEKENMTPFLFQYFVRRSIELKNKNILKVLLNNSDKNFFDKLRYQIGFKMYPLLKLYFKLK